MQIWWQQKIKSNIKTDKQPIHQCGMQNVNKQQQQ